MLGVAITTRNRPALAEWSVAHTLRHTPHGRVIVIDDCSDEPFTYPNIEIHRSPRRLGVAAAKTACLWYLRDCDPIILLDDDYWPVRDGWTEPLEEAYHVGDIHHLVSAPAYTDQRVMQPWDTHFHVMGRWPCGNQTLYQMDNCAGMLLFMTQRTLREVGALNILPAFYGYEHAAYSIRCSRAGLMGDKGPYLTVAGHCDYMWSTDFQFRPEGYDGPLGPSLPLSETQACVTANANVWRQAAEGEIYLPLYNPLTNDEPDGRVVATCPGANHANLDSGDL
jgi:glycosyltransferase involved in cell wall biosynthesis